MYSLSELKRICKEKWWKIQTSLHCTLKPQWDPSYTGQKSQSSLIFLNWRRYCVCHVCKLKTSPACMAKGGRSESEERLKVWQNKYVPRHLSWKKKKNIERFRSAKTWLRHLQPAWCTAKKHTNGRGAQTSSPSHTTLVYVFVRKGV